MTIVVVGDVLLDVDLDGSAERLCPDAPVPVVDVADAQRRAGGAGLVARMLKQDGHDVVLVTALAEDGAAGHLRRALGGIGVVAAPSGAPTPVKTRVRANRQPVVRFDEGCGPAPVPEATDAMIEQIEQASVIVVADYGRGLTANPRIRAALQNRPPSVPLVWDPHPRGAEPVPAATVVTPNLSESRALCEVSNEGVAGAAEAAEALRRRWGSGAVVVTMGGNGALISAGGAALPQTVPAPAVSVPDPCGAGDRFAASLAVALAGGADLGQAAESAVREAAAFLAGGGVAAMAAPEPEQLLGEGVDALRLAAETRAAGGTVVATGGCFDLLHAGHARTLAAARKLGDCLIVCLNSDQSVRRLKGRQRPIIGEQDRTELLLSLECVDAVVVFDEDTPETVLDQLRPDLWVKGGDYDADRLPEAALVRGWGGRTVTVPFYPARSTSMLAQALAKVG